jgi:hypothetical protein
MIPNALRSANPMTMGCSGIPHIPGGTPLAAAFLIRSLSLEVGMEKLQQWRRKQEGKLGYILLWALGVPIPVLFVIFLLRGCN